MQLYVDDQVGSLVTYEQILRGFQRITLAPGEAADIAFTLPASSLAIMGSDGVRRVEPGRFIVSIGAFFGRSSDLCGVDCRQLERNDPRSQSADKPQAKDQITGIVTAERRETRPHSRRT